MEPLLVNLLLTVFGGYTFFRNVSLLRDQSKLNDYLSNSSKAKFWIRKFGIEKTVVLSKRFFIPTGLVISLALIGAGLNGVALGLTNG